MPDGWPIVDRGLVMAYVGPVVTVAVLANIGDEEFDRHLVELERAMLMQRPGVRVGVFYDVPSRAGHAAARRRKKMGDFLEKHRERVQRQTAAYAIATPSAVVRGIVRAVFWLAPPPYPHEVVRSPREGFAYIAQHLPGVDVGWSEREYARVLGAAR